MVEVEDWDFRTARAYVVRKSGKTAISLRGIVTAAVYERLHLRMARERRRQVVVTLDWPALLAVTNISAVEAAVRGTPAAEVGRSHVVLLRVPPARRQWAERHSAIMSEHGLLRRVLPLPAATTQAVSEAGMLGAVLRH